MPGHSPCLRSQACYGGVTVISFSVSSFVCVCDFGSFFELWVETVKDLRGVIRTGEPIGLEFPVAYKE